MQTLQKKYHGLLLRGRENARQTTEVGVSQEALQGVKALDQSLPLIIRKSMSIFQSIIWVIVLSGTVEPRALLLSRVILW